MTATAALTPPSHPALAGLEREIDALRDAGTDFWRRNWSLGTSSNYSVVVNRNPLELLLTASGKDKGRLGRNDFVRVGADGKPTGEGQPKSSAETLLHVVVAQEVPNVGAILHTHSIWSTILSDFFHADGGFEISGYEMLKGLDGVATHETNAWVHIFENTQHIPSLAEEVRQRLHPVASSGDRPLKHGYLIRRHGLYTWGKDLEEARRHIEIYEFLFECVARRMMLDGVLKPAIA